ncbi:MAG TPA: glycine zipper 2TM domain-containing protein [Solimonas sp.]|nr:glycine zipper 2TM domain-containing protein [Solimonas sp.]
MSKLLIAALAGSLAVAPAAYAGSKKHQRGHARYQDSYQRYERDDRYETDYARVESARPIYREVRVVEPRRECWEERVAYRDDRNGYLFGHDDGSTIVGAIAGGVVGHQIGGGHGQDIATALGALIGASVAQQHSAAYREVPVSERYEERCSTVNDSRYEQRIDGYDVTYRYNGRLYHTRTPYDPGDRIAVRVDVQPVSY